MPKVPEEPVCLAREHPHPGRTEENQPAATASQPLLCVRHSAQRLEQDNIFSVHCGLAQRISGNPHGSSTVPAVPNPEQAVPFPAGLLLPALGNTQLLLGKLAKLWETRKAVPLPGQRFRPIAHIAAFLGCADLSYPCSWRCPSLPALLWVVFTGKHPRDTFGRAFIH